MHETVGIPRALLFYEYYPFWKTFFDYLGIKTIISPNTNQKILEEGVKNCVDEACLPIKLATGHVMYLASRADYIFVPRIVSLAPREYICPKFMGFPDMVRQCVPSGTRLIDTNINLYRHRGEEYRCYQELGKYFVKNPFKIRTAYQKSVKKQEDYCSLLKKGLFPEQAMKAVDRHNVKNKGYNPGGPVIAVIGHSYNLFDRHISMDLIKVLQKKGVNVVTAENLPEETMRSETSILPKRLFWTLGQKMLGAAFHYMKQPEISGIIYVVSFACGPDSMVGEIIERYIKYENTPFLKLTLDEHTGEAGVITRIEAFLDMVYWKAG
ncbi:MAG: acyl-CoA dehydratase activase-related protein [Clostridiales bacterium]|nr:acyl-CoA dehydratase activase-related protein [Clostridiales bacterium]MCF8021236.1 acyl-CoA dehydratase activase-related protein [Clostridiales bacterium]